MPDDRSLFSRLDDVTIRLFEKTAVRKRLTDFISAGVVPDNPEPLYPGTAFRRDLNSDSLIIRFIAYPYALVIP